MYSAIGPSLEYLTMKALVTRIRSRQDTQVAFLLTLIAAAVAATAGIATGLELLRP